jgi:hypothetical protein
MDYNNDITNVNCLICKVIMSDTRKNPRFVTKKDIDWSKINDDYINELLNDKAKLLLFAKICYTKYCEIMKETLYDPIHFRHQFWAAYILIILNTYIKKENKKTYINIKHACCGSECPSIVEFSTIALNELYHKIS